VAQVVESLPSKCEALHSTPEPSNNNNNNNYKKNPKTQSRFAYSVIPDEFKDWFFPFLQKRTLEFWWQLYSIYRLVQVTLPSGKSLIPTVRVNATM
jgi:hypothetical protein